MTSTGSPRLLAIDLGRASADDLRRIHELLPELEWIGDPTLRDVVARIWAHAWHTGPWSDPAEAHMIATLPRWNVAAHTRAAASVARVLAGELKQHSKLSFDMDVVMAVALLHDVAKLVEWGPTRGGPAKTEVGSSIHHAAIGAEWALEAGLSPVIAQAIYAHTSQSTATPTSAEGMIVKKVDNALAETTRFVAAVEAQPPKDH